VSTEQWNQETDAMDDVTLAQTLYDAIAASSAGFVMVSITPEGHFYISHGVDAESEDN